MNSTHLVRLLSLTLAILAFELTHCDVVRADVSVPNIFGSHMVLQQGQANPVWGWAEPDEEVTVTIGDQSHSAKADKDGRWRVKLASLPVGGPYELTIKGKNELKLVDVLVGEVWVCSGQSNMQWAVGQSDDADLEKLNGNHPMIRLVSVPQVGTQEPQDNFNGAWAVCSPGNVGDFSGVGYFFGRQLQETLGVPVGLIDNAWGGSACEAWVSRDRLAADERYTELLGRWAATESTYDHEKEMAAYLAKRNAWEEGGKKGNAPGAPRNPLTGQHRPANLYNGVLKPIIGYGIRGAIWYQGETNASRAYQYRHLFPLMIQEWRDDWGQGDFSFYWVQLADFMDESDQPQDSAWAELREAQTMTMAALPNTGEAVITDLGEAHDIHPKNKQGVGRRLARWALAKDYGIDITYKSPQYKSMETQGNKIVLTFDIGENGGGTLDTFDVREPIGFSIAGEDKTFVWAKARIIGSDKVEVWSDAVAKPVAVRYAWANNPVCNLQNVTGLPATPFRTDDWPGVTINNHQ
ncbi:MAG: sialate O-acetylesterase [Planctomycetaceae bacterium]|nr:sialate O-acetylesterase [Planctomycetales bacterium]MCB9921458.1 sialate O-acetylesterase [Planctomycetaceae bacterium]